MVFGLLPLVSLFMSLINTKRLALQRWESSLNAVAVVGARLRAQLGSLIGVLLELNFLLLSICAHRELALLRVCDLTYYIRDRRPNLMPEKRCRFSDLSRADCDSMFGLQPQELRRLFHHLHFPTELRTAETPQYNNRRSYNSERAFMIFLYDLCKGTPFTLIAKDVFGGDPRQFSEMSDLVNDHLYYTFYNNISGTSLKQWLPHHVHRYPRLTHNALSDHAIFQADVVNGQVDVTRAHGILLDLQQAMYSRYQKKHGLKALVVTLPTGIVEAVHVSELRHIDNGLQNLSWLSDYIVELLGSIRVGGLFPCLYRDSVFAVLPGLIPRQCAPRTMSGWLVNMRLSILQQICE